MTTAVAPILSTPAEHILEEPAPVVVPQSGLSEEQLYVQYEIKRTVDEIRAGKWQRIALQFPDEMLVDAPRVFERLRDDLKAARMQSLVKLTMDHHALDVNHAQINEGVDASQLSVEDVEERLCILGDTSYGACCVDEVAAEHVDADVVVHYGRACLSPTGRLPVIFVFTSKPLNMEQTIQSFKSTYSSLDEKVCLMADVPYQHHLHDLHQKLTAEGFTSVFETSIIRDPSSPLPNRALPPDVRQNPEALKDYAIFHISSPPASLLLILSSRVKGIHILPTDQLHGSSALESSTAQALRRRYALVTRVATAPVFGILINTLSVSNYMLALQHCQNLITRAGKKSYVFVVGKVNAAKVANFSEIGAWVVIGCWESSLIESKDFYRPIITPFELEVALTEDRERVWRGEWVGDFAALIGKERDHPPPSDEDTSFEGDEEACLGREGSTWAEQPSDDEPPEFDLRTGRYVSQSRPMGRSKQSTKSKSDFSQLSVGAASILPSSALVRRSINDMAAVNGVVSPAADFLRSKRTWRGLGSDYDIVYERDDDGRIRGAIMEEGRSGVAQGYTVGENEKV